MGHFVSPTCDSDVDATAAASACGPTPVHPAVRVLDCIQDTT